MNQESAIEAVGLTRSYGETRVLDGVDLRVAPGTVFALLGPNGAGKTTAVRILSTLMGADGGEARVAGFDIRRQRHEVRRNIAVTGQYASIDDLQTGAENLQMIGRLRRLSRSDARHQASVLLDRFGLTEAADRRTATYSGGMRRRLDLAASLMRPPTVLFLDEPTTGLDPASRLEMWSVVHELVQQGVTVFLTTQYIEEADQLAHRIVVLDRGRIVAEGTSAELKRSLAGHRLELTLRDAAAFSAVRHTGGDAVLHADPSTFTLSVSVGEGAMSVRALLDRLDPDRTCVTDFTVRTATLDDVFLALTGHDAGSVQKELSHV